MATGAAAAQCLRRAGSACLTPGGEALSEDGLLQHPARISRIAPSRQRPRLIAPPCIGKLATLWEKSPMPADPTAPGWRAIAVLVGRLIFAGVFAMALYFKLADIGATAGYIASAGFPAPTLLAWAAAIFEALLVLAFLSGAFFTEASLLAAAYVLFLAFAFHGPGRWQGELAQFEFGFFVDHFSFVAGLLFAAAHGPGRWAARRDA
jgi:putative oxidoreductase